MKSKVSFESKVFPLHGPFLPNIKYFGNKTVPKVALRNFILNICLLCQKSSDKSRWIYGGYGTAFNALGSWHFDHDFARNVIIFGVDNSSSSHTDNLKNDFLVLGEGPTDNINGSIGAAQKKFSIHFSKAKTKFCLSFHNNGHNSYLFVKGKKPISLKQMTKMSAFHLSLI